MGTRDSRRSRYRKQKIRSSRRAFSIVELLVVIAIIGILLTVLLPAVNAAREAARRTQCRNNLRQINLGVLNYASAHAERLPALERGVVASDERNTDYQFHGDAQRSGFSWRTSVLPYLDEQSLYDNLDFERPPDDPENEAATKTIVPVFQCPSTPGSPRTILTYGHDAPSYLPDSPPNIPAGANDYDALSFVVSCENRVGGQVMPPKRYFGRDIDAGAFVPVRLSSRRLGREMYYRLVPLVYRRGTRISHIVDGTSKTVLVAERGGNEDYQFWDFNRVGSWTWPNSRGLQCMWFNYITHHPDADGVIGRSNRHLSTKLYPHPHVAMCDGSVRSFSEELDDNVLWALVTRAGHEGLETH